MENEQLISIQQFCTYYEIEFSFIESLYDHGLIEIITVEETRFIHPDKMGNLEKMVRLHHDLNLNIEGIDVVSNLLQKINEMQKELTILKNKLRLYEDI